MAGPAHGRQAMSGREQPDQVPRLDRFRAAHPDVRIAAGETGWWQGRIPVFAERSLCKHCADLGFYVENMYATSAVSLSVAAAHRHQR